MTKTAADVEREVERHAPGCRRQRLVDAGFVADADDRTVDAEVRRRGLHATQGGSFGFRGHRYELIVDGLTSIAAYRLNGDGGSVAPVPSGQTTKAS